MKDGVLARLRAQAIGAPLASLVFGILVVALDAGGLRTLVEASGEPANALIVVAGAAFAFLPAAICAGIGLVSRGSGRRE